MTFDTALWRILLSHAVGCAAMPIIISLGRVRGGERVAGVEHTNPQFSCPSMVLHLSLSCCPRTDWFSFWCLRPMHAERPFEWPLTAQRQLLPPTPAQSHAPNQWVSLSIRAAAIRQQSRLIWLIEGDSLYPLHFLFLYLLCTIYAKCLLIYLRDCLTLLLCVAQLFADIVDGIN